MSSHRKRQRKWVLLFRWEEGQKVYLYEPLKNGELKSRIRKGWQAIN